MLLPMINAVFCTHVRYNRVQQNFGGNAVVFAGSKFAAVSAPIFLANNTYRVTSLSLVWTGTNFLSSLIWLLLLYLEAHILVWFRSDCRFWISRRVDWYRFCGRTTNASRVQDQIALLSAWKVASAQSRAASAKNPGEQLTAVWASRLHFPVLISTMMYWTLGIRWTSYNNIRCMRCTVTWSQPCLNSTFFSDEVVLQPLKIPITSQQSIVRPRTPPILKYGSSSGNWRCFEVSVGYSRRTELRLLGAQRQ